MLRMIHIIWLKITESHCSGSKITLRKPQNNKLVQKSFQSNSDQTRHAVSQVTSWLGTAIEIEMWVWYLVLKSCLSIFEFVVNLDFCNDCLEEFFSFYPFYVSSSWKSGWRYQYKRFFCIFEYQRKYLKYLMHVLGLATMTNSVVMNVPYCIWQHSLAFQSRWSAENILWRVEVGL